MASEKIKVSGCVVTFNNSDDIEACAGSLLKYTSEVDFELYVSDNSSSDDTLDKVRRLFPDVHILQNDTNSGFGAGHNAVMPLLDSKYHAVVNPDISVDRDVISELVGYMEANPDVGIVTPRILNPDGTEQHLPKRRPTLWYLMAGRLPFLGNVRRRYCRADENLSVPTPIDFCTGCLMLVRTELFKAVGGFDERYFMYFEDADLTLKIKKTHKAVYYPYTYAFHKWHRASSKSVKFLFIQICSMFKFFAKWGLKIR